MVQKRPFDAEEILEVSFKHPKHAGGPSHQLVPLSESVFPDDDCHTHMPKTSEGRWTHDSGEGNEKLAGEIFDELPREAEDSGTSFPVVGFPASSWATSCTTKEDRRSESPFHLAHFPEYLSPERPLRTFPRYDDIYAILLEHSPRKPVSVGADHQADVPPLDFMGAPNQPNAHVAVTDSISNVEDRDEAEKRLMGTCIIPMPQMDLSSNVDDDEVGKGRIDCFCEDKGSIRCVRRHIMEEREKLLKNFGHEKFTELGFADMGEQVAEKWSAEHEQLFHEVVYNNPSSLNKNFWNYLSIVFPSRTKQEIVSYYFNVFVLRKRAEQNRNHLDADSDNDEWQGSEGHEVATQEEEYEDSVAESPVCHDTMNNCNDDNMEDYDHEHASDDTCAVNETLDFTKSNIYDDSKYDDLVEMHHSSGSPQNQPQDQAVSQDPGDEKVKDDDSPTLSEMEVASQEETKVKSGNSDNWCGNYNGVSDGYSQGYVMEHCDAEVWDPGFVSCSKNKIDFLPTCSMIEEVFGDGRRQDMRRH